MIGIIFGPPGSGKGTQAARIEAEFHLVHVSTGQILRAEASRSTPLGRQAAEVMTAGGLMPDELVIDIVERRLSMADAGRGVLFDGFPRTVRQASAFDAMLAKSGHRIGFVIALEVPEGVLVDRLIKRAVEEGRADDTRGAITERMREYRAQTAAVLAYYRTHGVRIIEIAGDGNVDAVFERIRSAMAAPET